MKGIRFHSVLQYLLMYCTSLKHKRSNFPCPVQFAGLSPKPISSSCLPKKPSTTHRTSRWLRQPETALLSNSLKSFQQFTLLIPFRHPYKNHRRAGGKSPQLYEYSFCFLFCFFTIMYFTIASLTYYKLNTRKLLINTTLFSSHFTYYGCTDTWPLTDWLCEVAVSMIFLYTEGVIQFLSYVSCREWYTNRHTLDHKYIYPSHQIGWCILVCL